ncbi:hypothetical protein SAMN04488519_105364 [Algoriphagus ornithinivorans]|jgi:hypothetical protein|uniref:Uncharacterized protein n=1 Tax=Algoriphagus ornithinivorans TaxID=226506 RepID=A0A1I5GG91_9BACT|nr:MULTISPECIES: hypothetical protein [Algoriphagus]SFO35002.1 hypothetical protein SAMN04488519_105364 [Algoriphagus ornithinivorans]|tara:strand:- start:130 stop:291 length:162 start_codon:yes stop_codon:yes gene_type:complete
MSSKWKRVIKFKIGDVPWEIPLNVLLLLIFIAIVMMAGGAYLGFKFASGQLNP